MAHQPVGDTITLTTGTGSTRGQFTVQSDTLRVVPVSQNVHVAIGTTATATTTDYFVYCTDTVFSESAVSLSKNADVLVHESTFSKEDEKIAYEKLHSTTIMAAQTALLSNAKKLIITHLSPRYTNRSPITPTDLLKEAQKIFPNTSLAKDFLTSEIK